MPSSPGTFRLVLQRVGSGRLPSFRIVAYGESGSHAHAEFPTLGFLLDAECRVGPACPRVNPLRWGIELDRSAAPVSRPDLKSELRSWWWKLQVRART